MNAQPSSPAPSGSTNSGEVDGGLERVNYWLQCIQLWAPESPVIIVGTHLDEVSSEKVAAIEAEIVANYILFYFLSLISLFLNLRPSLKCSNIWDRGIKMC